MKISRLNFFGTTLLSISIAALFFVAFSLRAQTLPCPDTNDITKFILLPQVDGGLDVRDSGPDNIVLADDFFCNTPGPITDIHLWGSWLSDIHGTITNFWLGIYDDVPAITNLPTGQVIPSHPGTNLLWQQSFGPGQFAENPYAVGSEQFYDPPSASNIGFDTMAWYYCFFPSNAFVQQGTATNPTNYWLAVYASVSGPAGQATYGWKTALTNYNDAAVWGNVGATGFPIGNWQPMTNSQTRKAIGLSFKLDTTNTPPPTCNENNGAKYIQPPNFQGLDVWNSGPWVLADDFVCTNTGPVSDIHLWGSWARDDQPNANISFWLAVYDDVPVNPTNNFSHPGNLLWNQQFPPGQYIQSFWGTGSEAFLDPGPPNIIGPESNIWYYCFTPTNLTQYGSLAHPSNYWLMVYATLPSGSTNMYGWKTTTIVSNDVSVHAPWPGSPPIINPGWTRTFQASTGGPLDLAFKLTTQTNPCTNGPTLITSNIVVECGTSWIAPPPTVIDPCCNPPPGPVLVKSITNTTSFCPQYITNIWAATDCLGLSATNSQLITVVDTTPPTINCPTNFIVPCGTAWFFGVPIASDNCCLQGVIIVSTLTNGTPCSQFITRTWEAIDCCGNSNICSQSVTVVATNPPIMTCATNKSVPNGSSWTFDPPTATDACSGANVPVTVVGTVTNGTSPCGETFTRTWQAVDACNNTNFCSQTVTNVCPPVSCTESDFEKYVQGPNIFGGYDVWNTPYVLADDFVCTNTGPVSDIHLWGSWRTDDPLTNTINFWLGIYDDVPAFTNLQGVVTPSHPGTNLLWQQWFYHGQYAETIWTSNAQEQFLDPGSSNVVGPDSVVWYYCFYPTNAFQQLGSPTNHIIYWLAAYAQLPAGNQAYGWKTTTNVLHDTSVHAVWPGFPPISNPGWTPTAVRPPAGGPAVPLDLAFKITECGPRLKIDRLAPTNVIVTWDGGGHLQSATDVSGPYIDIPGPPTSPYTNSSLVPIYKFYRLRCYP